MSATTYQNTRRSPRVATRFHMKLLVESEGTQASYSVWTLEMSPLGARIQSDAPLIIGQAVELAPVEGSSYVLPGRIVWVSSPKPGELHAGIEFTKAWTD